MLLSRGPLRVGSAALDRLGLGRGARRAQGRRADLARRRSRAARTPLRAAIAASGITADSVRGRPAQHVLDDLASTQGVGEPLQAYLDEVAYRLVSGYDIADKYAIEMPDMLVGAIFGATDTADRHGDFTKRRDALRAKVPEPHRVKFDQWLEEARFIYRMRDERGR